MTEKEHKKAIEAVIQKFSSIDVQNEKKMEALVEQMRTLQTQMLAMKEKIEQLENNLKIEEYKEVQVQVLDVKEISLDMFKTLPEFNGERDKYSAWRNSALNVMRVFNGHTDKPKYFEALNIMRNKITGSASDTLTNYNTVFNFKAIISRLDFTYADKRPTYIIKQEMLILQQRNMSIEDFYDEVNKKLNVLINKINMTHKERSIAMAMIKDASAKALRTFITGLKGSFGRILYASDPKSLPEAYAKLQTIINDQERLNFANQFNQPMNSKRETGVMNANFKPKAKIPFQNNRPYDKQMKSFNKPEKMDVDQSSIKVNVGDAGKRPRSMEYTNDFRKKIQRVNQITDEDEIYAGDTDDSDVEEIDTDDEKGENEENQEAKMVFLD